MLIFQRAVSAHAYLPLALALTICAAPGLSVAAAVTVQDGQDYRSTNEIRAPGGTGIEVLGSSPSIRLYVGIKADVGIIGRGFIHELNLIGGIYDTQQLGDFYGNIGKFVLDSDTRSSGAMANSLRFRAAVGEFRYLSANRLVRGGIIFEGPVDTFLNQSSMSGGVRFPGGVRIIANRGRLEGGVDAVNVSRIENGGDIIGGDFGVRATGQGVLFNYGSIEGKVGVILSGGIRVQNEGEIISTGSVAVQLGPEDDLVVVGGNGSFQGLVDFGGGHDTLDISQQDGSTTIDVANLEAITGSTNYLQVGSKVYLTESRASGSGVLSASAIGVAGALNTVIDGVLGGDLFTSLEDTGPIAYAEQPSLGAAADATEAALTSRKTRPSQRAWITALGGGSTGTDLSSVFGGIVAGSHVSLSEDLDLGLLAGYTRSSAKTDGDHDLTADTFLFGPYGQLDLGGAELTFSLIGGVSANASARTIDADIASANFSSIFIAPSLGAEIPVLTGDGASLSLTASATYVTGLVAGYSETGSSQDLTLGQQTLGQLDSRLGAAAKFDLANSHHTIRAGAFHQDHTGSASVPVTLLGTTRSLDTIQAAGYGLYAGYALQVDLANTLSLTTAIDGSWRNDGQLTGATRVKLAGQI